MKTRWLLPGLLPALITCADGGPTTPSFTDVQVTTVALPDGGVGVVYSAALSATGGTGSHAWSIDSGTLPSGLTLSVGGAIGGTPTTPGTSSFAVRATSAGVSGTRAFAIRILPPEVVVSTLTLADGMVGAPYSQALLASGGGGTYAWTVAEGSLPPGLSLSGVGLISGSPTVAGTSIFTVEAASGGRVATQQLQLTIMQPAVTVSTAALQDAIAGASYSATLEAAGGTGGYSWRISTGSLPPGLSLVASGVISGTPSAGGEYPFTVEVSSGTEQATRALSITVQSPAVTIITTTLPDALLGEPYSQALTATGGTGSYTWSLAGGVLPAGLSLSASGLLSGTPAGAGTSSFSVKVESGGQAAALALTMTVRLPPLAVTTTALAAGTVGAAYSQQLSATGGTGTYLWSLAAGPLPPGLSLSPDGRIAGTPTIAGSSSFMVRVTSGGATATRDLQLQVSWPPVVITTSSLPPGTVAQPYTQALAAAGGDGSYAWSIAAGSLPPGLTLSAAGVIAGTPTTAGQSTFAVRVASGGLQANAQLTIVIGFTPVAITTATLPDATVGQAYTQALAATGGDGSYAWNILSGSIPNGLTLLADGTISGTPTTAGTSSFTVEVTSAGQTATQALTLTVVAAAPPVAISTTTLPDATVGQAYTQALAAAGGDGSYAWNILSGSIPNGLTLLADGTISGTPTTAGTSSFTVQVTSAGQTATQALTLTVVAAAPPVAISTTTLPDATVGQAYTQALAAAGGDGSYAWNILSGSIPNGLTLLADGTISGTPTTAGTSSFTVQVTSAGQTATQALTLTVVAAAPPVAISTTTLPDATVGQAYTQALAAAGGDGSYAWNILSGSIPNGLTLLADGTISGTPTTAGTSSFTVQVTSAGQTATQALTLTVVAAAPPVAISTTTLPDATVGQAYIQALAATGGDGSYAWNILSGSIPNGLTLLANGTISGTPTTAGTSSFTVQVTSAGQTATQALSLNVTTAGTNALVITTTSLPPGYRQVPYSQTLNATGGTGSYSWTLVSGTLPPGLVLSLAGSIAGTPSSPGNYTFSIQVSSGAQATSATMSIHIRP